MEKALLVLDVLEGRELHIALYISSIISLSTVRLTYCLLDYIRDVTLKRTQQIYMLY